LGSSGRTRKGARLPDLLRNERGKTGGGRDKFSLQIQNWGGDRPKKGVDVVELIKKNLGQHTKKKEKKLGTDAYQKSKMGKTTMLRKVRQE